MELALYKGEFKSTFLNRIFNILIKWWTKSKYSHVELVIKHGENPKNWRWISSENFIGVRSKLIQYNPDNWDFIKLTNLNEQDTLDFLNDKIGAKYDWKGIFLSNIFKLEQHDVDKWFCSELCFAALIKGGYFDINLLNVKPHIVTPEDLNVFVMESEKRKKIKCMNIMRKLSGL